MDPRTVLFLALAVGLSAPAAHPEEPATRTPVRLSVVSALARERIDRQALRLSGDTLDQEALRSIEDLPSALIGLEGMTPEQEFRRAAAAHGRLIDGRPAAPPPAAQRVFDRLVAELPPHLKPAAFRYRLTVFDRPGHDAFTTGGGFVYVTRSLIERLLADGERGEAALAFVLADEIGHAALGHTRRGWEQRAALAWLDGYVPFPLPWKTAGGALGVSASPDCFVFTAAEQEDADRFALHLCRNAGLDPDAVLDPVRLAAAPGFSGDKEDVQTVSLSGGDALGASDALARLKRLLMERDGLFDDETRYGLFVFDRRSRRLARCGPRQVGAGERPIVLVHGLRGNEYALDAYLSFLGSRPEVADRPLLVFRYPNNESLARCGQFLTREMRRCVVGPDKTIFVCHSAGGLVFRWYAEVRKCGFDRAIFLATPHAGTRMADLKGFVDVGRFVLDLPGGLDYALTNLFGEGDGQIAYDLHTDSLFLLRLGRETSPVARYQIFYGQVFDWLQALELQAGVAAAKQYLLEGAADFIPFPGVQNRAIRLVETATLPEEIRRGDLAVSAHSACLPGVAKTTAVRMQHEAFRYDPEMVRRVFAAILDDR